MGKRARQVVGVAGILIRSSSGVACNGLCDRGGLEIGVSVSVSVGTPIDVAVAVRVAVGVTISIPVGVAIGIPIRVAIGILRLAIRGHLEGEAQQAEQKKLISDSLTQKVATANERSRVVEGALMWTWGPRKRDGSR